MVYMICGLSRWDDMYLKPLLQLQSPKIPEMLTHFQTLNPKPWVQGNWMMAAALVSSFMWAQARQARKAPDSRDRAWPAFGFEGFTLSQLGLARRGLKVWGSRSGLRGIGALGL